jgi:glycosyltransferase involved in cell wall biosynthesis
MKNNSKPTVTIIIITWNVDRTINRVLDSISVQDYPKNLVDIIAVDGNSTDNTIEILKKSPLKIKVIKSPYPKDPEACRGVGLEQAKGDIICFIDSDNYLPNKSWLTKMITPFIEHKEIVGSETLRFAYIKNDNYLNRYFALIGSADPVGLYLGKADKLSYLSDEWRLYGEITTKEKFYSIVKFNPEEFPTLGSNGFCAWRKLLLKGKSDPEHYFHIDVPLDLAKLGYSIYAVVNESIIHDTATTLSNFLSKRSRYMRLHYQKRSLDRRYKVFDPSRKNDLLRIILFVIFASTFIQPTYVALKGYLKIRDKAWFVHPVFCFCIMSIYAYAVVEKGIKHLIISKK